MAILIKPFLGCNLECEYCYETEHREQHQPGMNYNLQAVLTAMEKQSKVRGESTSFGLHGGEPLCMPKQDVEAILAKAQELVGGCSVQTNATLFDDDHITMFKKYNATVGFSLDGPGELSRLRMPAKKADQIMKLIHRLIEQEDMRVSVMCVATKANMGTPELLSKFKTWLLELRQLNIGGRINPCGQSPEHQIDIETLTDIYFDLAKFQMEHGMSWSPFFDIAMRVRGEGGVCTFMGCDIFHTDSATVILGDGSITNCMRTNQGDIILRHHSKYNTRDEILQEIPQEHNGCRGCEFWEGCHGGCPMMTIGDDWRNRTYLCPLNRKLFGFYTAVTRALKIPLGNKDASDRIWGGHPGHTDGERPDHNDNHRDFPPRGRSEHADKKPDHNDNHHDIPPRGGRKSSC